MNIFYFRDYKEVIRTKIGESSTVHGYKGRLAEAAGCQRAYLSQVLNSHVQLTPDHAAGLAVFWGFSAAERDYFLDLVNHARAASIVLKNLIETKLENARAKNESVSGRIGKPKLESIQMQSHYYSSWHLSAIHILITIPDFRSVPAIAERLSLPHSTVSSALTVLAQLGLVKRQKEKWIPVSFDLHIPKNSPLNVINHMNWRAQAVQDAQREGAGSIHFSGVYSLSEKDFQKIRATILQMLVDVRNTALASPEEELVALTCDFFRV